ncbi:unnamed protein product, partial [Didymodactylos carnosus]
ATKPPYPLPSVQLFCEKLLNVKYLSCTACDLSFTDGELWENLITTCFPFLFQFNLLFAFMYPVPSHINISEITEKFQTQFWSQRKLYFVCDYCPSNRATLELYSMPYNNAAIEPLINIYKTTSSSIMIYDKVKELFIKFSTTRDLNTQRIYPNVSSLVLLNEDDNGELFMPFPSLPFVSDIGKIIVWENLRKLRYFCNNYDLMVDVLKCAKNIIELEFLFGYFKNILDKINWLFINIKTFNLVDGFLETNTIEKLSISFPQLEHLTVEIDEDYELYTILPLLVNLSNISYVAIRIYSVKLWKEEIEYWLKTNTLFSNFSIDFDGFRLRLWCE